MATSLFATQCLRLIGGGRRALRLSIVSAIIAGCGGDTSAGPAPEPGPAPVVRVVVTPDPLVLIVGMTVELAASPRDVGDRVVPGRPVSWSTSDPGVAEVTAEGVVTGVGVGRVRITATSEGKSGSVDMQLVFLPIASVDLTPNAVTLPAGGTQQLTASPRSNTGAPLPGRVVTWSSSDPATATVNASGLVAAAGVGSATITATSEGRTASAQVTVVPAAGAHVAVASRRP